MMRLELVPLSRWPTADQAAWKSLFEETSGPLSEGGRGLHLSGATRALYLRVYSLWLAHLASIGELDPEVGVAERVTESRINGWLTTMRKAGRSNNTIALYVRALHAVFGLLHPGLRITLMLQPDGLPLRRLLPPPSKPVMALDVADVLWHVRHRHASGLAASTPFAQRTALRDAALLAVLITRAPRVSHVAAMRLGEHLIETPAGGFICRWIDTNKKKDQYASWTLDLECAAFVRDYIEKARPLFPRASETDAVWLGNGGDRLDRVGVASIFVRRMRAWFGEARGTHVAHEWLRS